MAEIKIELLQSMIQKVLDNQHQQDGRDAELRLRMIAIEQRSTSMDTRLDAIQLQLTNLSEDVAYIKSHIGLVQA